MYRPLARQHAPSMSEAVKYALKAPPARPASSVDLEDFHPTLCHRKVGVPCNVPPARQTERPLND